MHKIYHSRRLLASLALSLIAWISVFLVGNRQSLLEGMRYLWNMWRWQPDSGRRVQQNGRFAHCYKLVGLTNEERYRYIRSQLAALGLEIHEIAVPGELLPNLFVQVGPAGPSTLLIAHFDIARETPEYQGASDNSAAVAVLLSALQALRNRPPMHSIGVLFSAAEERGMLGAQAFLHYSQANHLAMKAALNFDMLGRDKLAIRPSALPGFYLWVPLIGEIVYDGRHLQRAASYLQPDPQLIRRIAALAGNTLVVYRRFTARSDSNVFQEAGIPTVAISSADMYYLDLIWERDSDRVELLDERNLELAFNLICRLAHAA